MDIETQLINELTENGTEKARELFLKWQEQRIKAKERLIEKLKVVDNNCDLADVSGSSFKEGVMAYDSIIKSRLDETFEPLRDHTAHAKFCDEINILRGEVLNNCR